MPRVARRNRRMASSSSSSSSRRSRASDWSRWRTLTRSRIGPTWRGRTSAGGEGPPFQLPDLGLTTRAQTIKLAPWRLASQVFGLVVSGTSVPDFLSPGLTPVRTAIVADPSDPNDPANQWGVNSAQTAYILLRLPFRILIHADNMLPA